MDQEPPPFDSDQTSHARETLINQGRFLAELAKWGNISQAAREANVARASHYVWMQQPAYQANVQDAWEMFRDRIRAKITELAQLGWDEPVFQGGREVGTVRKHSERLLELQAKALLPEYATGPREDRSAEAADLDETWDERVAARKALDRARAGAAVDTGD